MGRLAWRGARAAGSRRSQWRAGDEGPAGRHPIRIPHRAGEAAGSVGRDAGARPWQ